MVRPRSLLFPSVIFLYSVCVVGASVGRSEVTLTNQAGDVQSSLFSQCLAMSRSFEATFASIEVVLGSEYIRYMPDSLQLRYPVSWNSLTGNYPSIFECAEAANAGKWPMFKYNGLKCEVVNVTFSFDDDRDCEEEDSDAVFILSTVPNSECPIPRFRLGVDSSGDTVCGLVSEDLMTYDEAKIFCNEVYHTDELAPFENRFAPLTVANVITKLVEHGYTNTNLWVGARELNYGDGFYGNFYYGGYWVDGDPATTTNVSLPISAGYMDPTSNYKLRKAYQTFKAGVLCATLAPFIND